jgi:hypothetical protein
MALLYSKVGQGLQSGKLQRIETHWVFFLQFLIVSPILVLVFLVPSLFFLVPKYVRALAPSNQKHLLEAEAPKNHSVLYVIRFLPFLRPPN